MTHSSPTTRSYDLIETLQRRGQGLGVIAIRVRAGFQTRAFEERFVTLGIPYRVIGGPRFYERQEVRDALAYLRAIVQPADDPALARIITLPRRATGNATPPAGHLLEPAKPIPFSDAARRRVETRTGTAG